jgi:hypothetical protein
MGLLHRLQRFARSASGSWTALAVAYEREDDENYEMLALGERWKARVGS